MGVILINGVPGSGKTTIAYKLAAILEIEEVIQTDTIKEVFKVINHPEIALSTTHSAWKFFGEKNEQNIINGFKAHTKYFEDFLLKIIEITEKEGKNIIIEGVHATPRLYSLIETKNKISFFLNINESSRLVRCDVKNSKRKVKNTDWYNNSDVISFLNSYLLSQSMKNEVVIIYNNNIKYSLEFMIKCVKEKIITRGVSEYVI
ncbi:AAA family ATPase [Candidatus Pacearchaeota archaeon]|nr:AAA family ATPase [Candidatus Pacearchaeota archaeon]